MESKELFLRYETIIDGLAENNWMVVENLFDPAVLDGLSGELQRLYGEGDFRQAGIGKQERHQHEKAVRSDKIHWIGNHSVQAAEQAFNEQIGSFAAYLNRTCYTGIRDWEFHYACFEQGNFYKRHLDRFKNDESRKFSVVTYLNRDWTEADGGALVLFLEAGEQRILPQWGTTVIFKSELIEHEVLPATRNRYSVTGWLK